MVLYFGWLPLSVLVASTFIEWNIALKIESSQDRKKQWHWLLFSIVTNIAVLAFFKYSGFFLSAFTHSNAASMHILMPVGLSFWTLQKMTLSLDVYFKKKPAEKSFFQALLFTSFFPTLLSGPIEYSRKVLPQFKVDRKWNPRFFSEGIWLFCLGAFLKAVIADNVAVTAEQFLNTPNSGIGILIGAWAYALQLYGDFAGYSYMARGIARMIGIDITQNFLAPYLMRNLSDFWKHWHISLSSWLNEYIFTQISFKLRNWGMAGMVLAIWATFIVSGLWHGTGLTYFVYGCLHAIGITIFTLTKNQRKWAKNKWGKSGPWLDYVSIFITFHWVCFTYLFFRAPTLPYAVSQIASAFSGSWNPLTLSVEWWVLGLSAFAIFWLQGQVMTFGSVFWIFNRTVWYRVAFYLVLGFLLLRCYAPSDRFIYFQF